MTIEEFRKEKLGPLECPKNPNWEEYDSAKELDEGLYFTVATLGDVPYRYRYLKAGTIVKANTIVTDSAIHKIDSGEYKIIENGFYSKMTAKDKCLYKLISPETIKYYTKDTGEYTLI